ncbi:MAG: pilin [Candidatus Paceibacterota bacterium]
MKDKFILIPVILAGILLPGHILAQMGPPPSSGGTMGPAPSEGGGALTLNNPLGNQTLMGFLQDILEVIMIFAVPLIVFMIIYAGFKYVMARGNPGEIGKAHQAILYAVIGGVLILGAWVILEVIQGTVDAFRT